MLYARPWCYWSLINLPARHELHRYFCSFSHLWGAFQLCHIEWKRHHCLQIPTSTYCIQKKRLQDRSDILWVKQGFGVCNEQSYIECSCCGLEKTKISVRYQQRPITTLLIWHYLLNNRPHSRVERDKKWCKWKGLTSLSNDMNPVIGVWKRGMG